MKLTKKILAMTLAIILTVTAVGVSVFAAVESPIIPLPGGTETPWFEYEYDSTHKTATLKKFNFNEQRTKVNIGGTTVYEEETYQVVAIADEVFKGTDIVSLEIASGLTTIGAEAFANCAKLASIKIPASVVSIAPDAFEGTAWLDAQEEGIVYAGSVAYKVKGECPAAVTIPVGTVALVDGLFSGKTALEKIVILEETLIGKDAFLGCTNLTIYCYENSPANAYAVANGINFVLIPSLVLESAPTKLEYYQNDELNLAGIKLIYISEAGENEVEVTPEMISGYDAATLGPQTVTVTYEGKTVQFQVTVVERPAYIVGDLDGSTEVDMDDAIYLLFYAFYEDEYPLNQPCDFDKSGGVDMDDAIYLLFHTFYADDYPLI